MGFYDVEKLLHRKEHHCQSEEICRVGKMSATCQMTPENSHMESQKIKLQKNQLVQPGSRKRS